LGRPAEIVTFDFVYIGFAVIGGMIFVARRDFASTLGMILLVGAGIV
jgi:hypothetical protein